MQCARFISRAIFGEITLMAHQGFLMAHQGLLMSHQGTFLFSSLPQINQSHTKQILKYILAVWPRDNSRPPSFTLSLARTSERHSRILYPSCTHCRVQTRAKNLFAPTLPYSLGPLKQHTPPATTAGQATTTRSAVHGIGCKAYQGTRTSPTPS